MNDHWSQVAEQCLRGAETNLMTFPEVVGRLMENGFESYATDFRKQRVIYYRPDGQCVELPTHSHAAPVADAFDAAAIQVAIKEAQRLVAGYTYDGFCQKIMAAGCAGYIVSFPGRRAVYFGRTAETHVEQFPQ